MFSSLLAFLTRASAEPVKVGDPAPVVTGVTETGAKLNLGDVYKQQTYTLVYFYPKADTPGCTKQGCSLRDGYEALTKKGVAVIGVSHDDVAAQKAFKEKYHLPFTLIADTDKSVINAFGVPTKNVPVMGEFASRSAYLIKDGKIVYTDYKGTTDKQAEVILAVIDGAK
jgi:peroxiredoxin Q/BCP